MRRQWSRLVCVVIACMAGGLMLTSVAFAEDDASEFCKTVTPSRWKDIWKEDAFKVFPPLTLNDSDSFSSHSRVPNADFESFISKASIPQLGGADHYRVIFTLINKKYSHRDVKDYVPWPDLESRDGWVIEISSSENKDIPIMTITQQAHDATVAHRNLFHDFSIIPGDNQGTEESCETNDTIACDRTLHYYISPAIKHDDVPVVRSVGTGKPPLVVARYIVSASSKGRSLGFVNANLEDPDPEPCLVNVAALESKPTHDTKINFFETLQYERARRPAIQYCVEDELPPSDQLQSQIDRLTGGIFWIQTERYQEHRERAEGVSLDASQEISPCTAFLVSDRHLMTARHCVADDKYPKFDCQRQPCFIRGWIRPPGGGDRFSAPDFQNLRVAFRGLTDTEENSNVAMHDRALKRKAIDYAVLELSEHDVGVLTASGACEGDNDLPCYFELANEGVSPRSFFIPQYPNARNFVASYDRYCGTKFEKFGTVYIDGSDIDRKKATTIFKHFCDTMGGSSGAPVMTQDLAHVLGVHVKGWGKPNTDSRPGEGNRATKMSEILGDIKCLAMFSENESVREQAQEIILRQSVLTAISPSCDRSQQGPSGGAK